MRRRDRIDDFIAMRHNPAYLTGVPFDVERIFFTDDINGAVAESSTLLLAMPSPYFKSHIDKITLPLNDKNIITAIKGIVPDENRLVTDYMIERFGVKRENLLVVSGHVTLRKLRSTTPASSLSGVMTLPREKSLEK